jgi:hypothetical protein
VTSSYISKREDSPGNLPEKNLKPSRGLEVLVVNGLSPIATALLGQLNL